MDYRHLDSNTEAYKDTFEISQKCLFVFIALTCEKSLCYNQLKTSGVPPIKALNYIKVSLTVGSERSDKSEYVRGDFFEEQKRCLCNQK